MSLKLKLIYSGGYCERIMSLVSQKLGGKKLETHDIKFKKLRNKDFSEAICEVNGEKISFVRAYGFRNIQNVVQKVKLGKCKFHYVEVMACPSGCLNGGGQVKLGEGEGLEGLEEVYRSVGGEGGVAEGVAEGVADEFCRTEYHAIEKVTSALSVQW